MTTLSQLELATIPRQNTLDKTVAGWHVGPDLTVDLVNFLLVRPSFADIAQYLCSFLFAAHQPWSATIFQCSDHGVAQVLGDFGSSPESSANHHNFDCSTHSPIARALFQGLTVANFETPSGARVVGGAEFDWFSEGPSILHPLSAPSRFLGAIHLRFLEKPDSANLVRDLASVAPALALLLEMLASEHRVEQHNNGASSHLPIPEKLSPRQSMVLTLMAEQKTNAQISRIIGFSESTVRQETMAIFRFLGVHDRRAAVKLATSRGILLPAA